MLTCLTFKGLPAHAQHIAIAWAFSPKALLLWLGDAKNRNFPTREPWMQILPFAGEISGRSCRSAERSRGHDWLRQLLYGAVNLSRS